MTAMTDEQLDQAIAGYLTWRSSQVDGAPEASAVAGRIADAQHAHRPRWRLASSAIFVVALVSLALVGAILLAGRQSERVGPLANGPLVVANALGWSGIDPASGAAIHLEPCAGRCEEAMEPRLSADGRTVFFVDPSHDGGDLRSNQPGWAIWRWDRLEGTVRRVAGCDGLDCTLRRPIPSPDGRYLAFARGGVAPTIPMPPVDEIVVVDAETGREVRRIPDLVGDGYWIEFANFAWDADGQLLFTDLRTEPFRHRRIDVITGAETDVTLPQYGLLESSPDGGTLVMTDERDPRRLWLLDDRFENARLLWEGYPPFRGIAWSPDGTRIAAQTRSEALPPRNMDYTTQVIDIATGALTTPADDDAAAGQPLWLPRD